MEARQLLINPQIPIWNLRSINCPHCEKAIVFEKVDGECPNCNQKYEDKEIRKLIFNYCGICSNYIKYLSCPHCENTILVHPSLPETKLVCKLKIIPSFAELAVLALQEVNELMNTDINNFITSVIKEKGKKMLDSLFHNFDLKSEQRLTEIVHEMYNNRKLTDELLLNQADIKIKESKGDEEKEKAAAMKEAVKHIDKLTPQQMMFLTIALFGGTLENLSNINFDEEFQKAQIKKTDEETRKVKIENDHNEWKKGEARKDTE